MHPLPKAVHLLLAAAFGLLAGALPCTPALAADQKGAPVVPLVDLGSRTYHGLEGGLYPGGTNDMPAIHAARGRERAARIQPLYAQGCADPAGKIVLMSVGMSNTSQAFCNPPRWDPLVCRGDRQFMSRAARDPPGAPAPAGDHERRARPACGR